MATHPVKPTLDPTLAPILGMPLRQLKFAVAAGLLSIPLTLALIIWFLDFRPISFNAQTWRRNAHRAQMVQDLQRHIHSEHWPKPQVLSQLGIDNRGSLTSDPTSPGHSSISYSIDTTHSLDITFNPDNSVLSIEISEQRD